VNDKVDGKSLQEAIHQGIFTTINEEILVKNIKSRSRNEWRDLYIRRVVLIFLNFSFIIGCSTIIVWTNQNK